MTLISRCVVCNKNCKELGRHVVMKHHLTPESYYLKYIGNKHRCLTCNNETSFLSINKGYRTFCSVRCSSINHITKDKVRNTCLNKYGVEHISKLNEVQQRITNTCIKKYGNKRPTTKPTNTHTKQANNRRKLTRIKKLRPYLEQGYITRGDLIKECGQSWLKTLDYPYIIVSGNHLLPKDFATYVRDNYKIKLGKSIGELDLYSYIKSIYKGTILLNNKKVIYPQELDIYLPDLNIAFEFNGDWYHSIEKGLPREYHINKTILCEKLGIRLVHIFEWEWINRKDYIKGIINKAIGLHSTVIDFRDCYINEIDNQETFLFNNLSETVYNCKYGLFYQNVMVGIFYNLNDSYILYTKNDITVINISTPLYYDRGKYLIKGEYTDIRLCGFNNKLHFWDCGYVKG